MMKSIIISICAIFTLLSCTTTKNSKDTRKLILYYSQTNTTKTVAEELQRKLDADIEQIEVEEPYTGTFEETIERGKKEMEENKMPAIKPLKSKIEDYDIIFIGYPIWFGNYALPIVSLLKEQSFDGKTIVPFCTFGSGGLVASSNNLKTALPKAEIMEGFGIRNARIEHAAAEVNRFLLEKGYVNGEYEKFPEYSAQIPVTEKDKDLFNQACGDYPYPLGTPVTVGKRETKTTIDYLFTTKAQSPDGKETLAKIYVTTYKDNSKKAEFTMAER